MYLILTIFWSIRTVKYLLFWIYLWQLKEYHVGRFLDHFKTYKGKKIVLNYFLLLKIILFLAFVFASELFSIWFLILFFIYVLESFIFLKQFAFESVKRAKTTLKTIFLTLVSAIAVGLFLTWLYLYVSDKQEPAWLLVVDILLPLIVSFIVLFFQPLFVFLRNNILKKAAFKIKELKGLKVICITGSYGKTSTKEFLTTILSKNFSAEGGSASGGKVLSTKEHQNSEIGVANCVLNDLKPDLPAEAGHQFFIAEVGAYNKGKVKEVCSMLQPKIGVVTGVNEQHLSLFGSLDNLLSAEGGRELVECLPENGLLVVNGDNKYCLDLYKKSGNLKPENKKIYSINKNKVESDVLADNIDIFKTSVSFMAVENLKNGGRNLVHFDVNALGQQSVQNLLAAICVAKELGMTLEEISDACKEIKQEQSGIILKRGKHGIDVIDSSYSSNPDGVLADLDYLSVFSQKRVIVMPCLIELGSKSSEIHEKIGRKIGQVCDVAIITTKDRFNEIRKGAVESGMKEKNIIFSENPNDIYSQITLFCTAGDAVLLEGRVPKKLVKLLTAKPNEQLF